MAPLGVDDGMYASTYGRHVPLYIRGWWGMLSTRPIARYFCMRLWMVLQVFAQPENDTKIT